MAECHCSYSSVFLGRVRLFGNKNVLSSQTRAVLSYSRKATVEAVVAFPYPGIPANVGAVSLKLVFRGLRLCLQHTSSVGTSSVIDTLVQRQGGYDQLKIVIRGKVLSGERNAVHKI